MSLDSKILKNALLKYEEDKRNRASDAEARLMEVYVRIPRIKEIDQELKNTMIDTIGYALKSSGDPKRAIENIRDKNLSLQKERCEILKENGYPIDYTDDIPACPICDDKGFVGSKPCQCLMNYYRGEQNRELGGLLNLSDADFNRFDLSYYSDVPDMKYGASPRQNMELIYEYCIEYSRKFGANSSNLLFTGSTGLGKTLLSACIAKVVAEKGFFVCYNTSVNIFASFENEKFSRDQDVYGDSKRYLDCDLLILDDLGTELTTSFTVSALYTLINTRLMTNKKTIINTNLTPAELNERYSPQIISRLRGEYETLCFYGKDIRIQKKDRI